MTTTALTPGTYKAPAIETKEPKLGARVGGWILQRVPARVRKLVIWGASIYGAVSIATDILIAPAAAACTAVLIGG